MIKQCYILVIYSLNGLKSKERYFDSLSKLFYYIALHDNKCFEKYEIIKGLGYVKS